MKQDPDDELREELTLLRTSVARKLRQTLDADGPVSPAWIEAARKFLSDQGMTLAAPPGPAPAEPVTNNLPFPVDETQT